MDRIDLMRTYLAVADTGSFTAAAKRMKITPQLASKYVRALEDDLGSQLFNRSTRRVDLTKTGTAFYDRCAQLIEDYEDLTAAVRQDHHEPRGELRVSAPVNFGELYLLPALRAFTDVFPGISVNLNLTDRFIDLQEEAVDVAIRIGELTDSSMIARRIAATPVVICASPAYLAKNQFPKIPIELLEHTCIIDTNFEAQESWPFVVDGVPERVSVKGRFSVNSASAVCDLAVRGHGIAMIPSYMAAKDIEAGNLVTLLDDFVTSNLTIYAVYLETRHLSAKVRSFVDFATKHLKHLG